ncbi:MAG: hypothetical protein D8M59_11670 [Planctomycetes bacterium]|nr:hypothetical protein [Planctomycetota bacterium]
MIAADRDTAHDRAVGGPAGALGCTVFRLVRRTGGTGIGMWGALGFTSFRLAANGWVGIRVAGALGFTVFRLVR